MGFTWPLRRATTMATDPPSDPSSEPLSAEATVELLHKAKLGDESALDRLLERCIPRCGGGRTDGCPASARGMLDTADLVQDAVIAAMRRLDAFEPRHQGALQAYLRKAVLNRIRDIARPRKRGLDQTDLPDDLAD